MIGVAVEEAEVGIEAAGAEEAVDADEEEEGAEVEEGIVGVLFGAGIPACTGETFCLHEEMNLAEEEAGGHALDSPCFFSGGDGGQLGAELLDLAERGGREAWVLMQPNEVVVDLGLDDHGGDTDAVVLSRALPALEVGAKHFKVGLAIGVEGIDGVAGGCGEGDGDLSPGAGRDEVGGEGHGTEGDDLPNAQEGDAGEDVALFLDDERLTPGGQEDVGLIHEDGLPQGGLFNKALTHLLAQIEAEKAEARIDVADVGLVRLDVQPEFGQHRLGICQGLIGVGGITSQDDEVIPVADEGVAAGGDGFIKTVQKEIGQKGGEGAALEQALAAGDRAVLFL